jgi:hypothetical protein
LIVGELKLLSLLWSITATARLCLVVAPVVFSCGAALSPNLHPPSRKELRHDGCLRDLLLRSPPACVWRGSFALKLRLTTILRGLPPIGKTFAAAPTFERAAKRLETGRDGVRFCFKAPGLAEGFETRFGGERGNRSAAMCKSNSASFKSGYRYD